MANVPKYRIRKVVNGIGEVTYYVEKKSWLFGWENAFPSYEGFCEITYRTEEEAMRAFKLLSRPATEEIIAES